VEHNATSTHNLKDFLADNTRSKSLFNKSKTILIEDPDLLNEEELQSLSGAIRKTNMPIVIITNNLFDYKFSKLKKNCILIEFKALTIAETKKRLCLIAIKENILDQMRIDTIASRCNGDMRVAINDLESGTNDSRDNKCNILLTMRKIFYAHNYAAAIKAAEHSDLDVDMLFEWIYENLPSHISHPLDLAEAMDALSKADVLRKKAKTDSVYTEYILEFLSAGVWACKQRTKIQLGLPFKFPTRML
jgi:DNA polymerase III delta prime subunit